jgi:hypothetical protein
MIIVVDEMEILKYVLSIIFLVLGFKYKMHTRTYFLSISVRRFMGWTLNSHAIRYLVYLILESYFLSLVL